MKNGHADVRQELQDIFPQEQIFGALTLGAATKFYSKFPEQFSGTPKLVTWYTSLPAETHPSLVVKDDKPAKSQDVSVPAKTYIVFLTCMSLTTRARPNASYEIGSYH